MERYNFKVDEFASDARSGNANNRSIAQLFDYIYENAMGVPIEFDAVPTLELMKPNTWGYYGNDVYIKTSSGTGIKLSGSAFT